MVCFIWLLLILRCFFPNLLQFKNKQNAILKHSIDQYRRQFLDERKERKVDDKKNIFLNNDTRRSAIKSPQFKFETLRPKHLSPKSHNRIFLIILLWALIIPSWLPSSGSWDLVTFTIPLNVYVTSTNFGYDKVARNPCLRDSLLIEWYLGAFETQNIEYFIGILSNGI